MELISDFGKLCDKCNSLICSCIRERPIDKWLKRIHCGDSLKLAGELPNESIDMVITSPPYFQLRNYLPNGHADKDKEIGIEQDPHDYINNLVKLFNILKQKLKDSGTLWVNLGDVYFGGSGGPQSFERNSDNIKWSDESKKNPHRRDKPKYSWMKPKQLMLIPSRFAIAMQEAGWILRSDIIWHKPNAMPTSTKDRLKNSYEHLFFFVKSKRYYFNMDLIREPHKTPLNLLQNRINYDTERRGGKLQNGKIGTGNWSEHEREINPLGTVPQDTFYEDNFPKNPDSRMRLDTLSNEEKMHPLGTTPSDFFSINPQPHPFSHFAVYPLALLEKPIKAGCPANGIILDPFIGSGTTAIASEMHGNQWIGFELNNEYIKIALKRIGDYRKSKEYIDADDFKEIQKLKKDAEKTKLLAEFL